MDIEGTYTLQAAPEDVWQCLADPQVLRQAIPGIERLERVDERTYDIGLHIRHAPLIGFYQGRVRISQQHYPESYHIAVTGEGRQGIGTISGEGSVLLSRHGSNTVIVYQGAVHLARPESLLPPPLVRATARMLLQQFFTVLADYLRTMRPAAALESANEEWIDIPAETANDTATPAEALPLLHRVVRALRLGNGDAAREEQWVRSVKRVGAVLALAFLVWIGTRLPRRIGAD